MAEPGNIDFADLELQVRQWGVARDLYWQSSVPHQMKKLTEELGELSLAIKEKSREGMVDGIGDMVVVLIHIARFIGIDVTSCLEYAYSQIKDRKGKIIDGVFVKSTDTEE